MQYNLMLDFVEYLENACMQPLKLNILDLVIFGRSATKWIYTDKNSLVQFKHLNNCMYDTAIKCFTKSASSCKDSDVII